jgi:hypothetical protein
MAGLLAGFLIEPSCGALQRAHEDIRAILSLHA